VVFEQQAKLVRDGDSLESRALLSSHLLWTMTMRKRNPPTRQPAPRLDDGTQLRRLRRLCLSIPGTTEKVSHGAPTFFTPKRVFATFVDNHHDDGHVAAWLPAGPGVQEALIEEASDVYFRPPYVGCKGWIGVELAKIDDDRLGALVREGFNRIVRPRD
jgi:hypothetical protein